jgi:hypothetical protein
MTAALGLLHGGPLGCAEELASMLPWRPRLAIERWVAAVRAVRSAVRPREVWSLSGTASVDGRPLHVVTDLGGDALAYWSGLFFAGRPTRTSLGHHGIGGRLAMRGRGDLVLMSHHRVFRCAARRRGFFTVPSWLDTGLPIAESVAATLAQPAGHRSRQSDLRRIRRAALHPLVVRDATAVREFLHAWYLPYVQARWGDTCVAPDAAWRRRVERYCEVLWVMRGAERVAGLLLESQGPALRMVVVGMTDAAHRRDGALPAAYYFAIEEAVRRGRRRLRTGGTRPVLSDGVLEFKRKWGAQLSPMRQLAYLGVGCAEWSPTVRALLARHPLVVEASGGEFVALTDAAALADPRSAAMRCLLELGGIAGLVLPDGAGGGASLVRPEPRGRGPRDAMLGPAAACPRPTC